MSDDFRIEEPATPEFESMVDQWLAASHGATGSESPSAAPREELEVPVALPKSIRVLSDATGLALERRWFSATTVFMTVFAVFWNAFMVMWFAIAISSGEWAMAAFGSIHGAVGLGLIYAVVAQYRNRTVIRVADGALSLTHGPVPWPGGTALTTDDLQQLYVKRRVSHSSKGGTSISYELRAVHGDPPRDIKLIGSLGDPDVARFIERAVEDYLGIRDMRVRGEYE